LTTTFGLVATLTQDATSVTATASVTLAALNNPPVDTLPGGLSVNESAPLDLTGFSVTDPDAGGASLVTTVQVDHGTLTATQSGADSIAGNGSGDVTITGDQTDITATLNSLVYTSAANGFFGTDTLFVSTNDQGNTGVDGAKTDTESTYITVNEVNHAPVLDAVSPLALAPVYEQPATSADATAIPITTIPVGSLVPTGAISDIDLPYDGSNQTTGIAVTQVDNTHGQWWYSTDSGATWTLFTTATGGVENIAATAVLLDGAVGSDLVKFVPNTYWNSSIGPADPTLTYVAWDESDGNAPGDIVDLTATGTGGSTHFSSATEVVTESVIPVNDAPTLTLLTDNGQADAGGLSVTGNRGLHTYTGFVVASSPGGGSDESGQALTYSISTDNPSLFSLAPTIDADGTLSYVTATGATGTANVTVTLTDSGGTDNGGIDSPP
jgi:hypothetical protein